MNEKLSALMDGELGEAESQKLLSQLKTDKDLRAAWGRYHLAGSVLREEATHISDTKLADSLAKRVAKEIENEPQILVPRNWLRHSNRKITKKKIIGMVGSFAIAASVAAIAIISLQVETTEQRSQQNIAKQSPANLNSISTSDFIRASGTRWKKGTTKTEKVLNMYLVEHGEFTPSSNFKGMMSYGRIVSYDMIE